MVRCFRMMVCKDSLDGAKMASFNRQSSELCESSGLKVTNKGCFEVSGAGFAIGFDFNEADAEAIEVSGLTTRYSELFDQVFKGEAFCLNF